MRQPVAWRPPALKLLVAIALSGCFNPPDPSTKDSTVEQDGATPYAEDFATLLEAQPETAPPQCTADPSPLTQLTFSVRTTPTGGRFAPRNVGAIWIESADGTWLRTLERWGNRRAKWLISFNEASGGDVIDAVTSATLPRHTTHEAYWDLTSPHPCEVANGEYQVRIEVTDWSGSGETASFPFEKGVEPTEYTFADTPFFKNLKLTLE